MRDFDRLVGGLPALHRYSAHGERLPAVSWTTTRGRVASASPCSRTAYRVGCCAWTASSPTRDFREARWSSQSCQRTDEGYACSVARAPDGYTAAYAELWFKDPGYPKFPLATVVCIAGRGDVEPPDC